MITRRDVLSATAAAFCAAHLPQPAQAHPIARPVHILTGFAPGLQDALARLVAGQMSSYAETIVVEPRPGASGRIAVEAVKNGDADGSVLLFGPLGFMTLFPHVHKSLRYQPQDFAPVSTAASTPTLLTVGPKVPADVKTLADFVVWCRANPKLATYGTAGAGTTLHFLGTMLGRSAGFDFLHVPYQGGGAISGSAQGRDCSRCDADRQFARARPVRRSACAGDHRTAPQPVRSGGPDDAGSGISVARGLTWFAFFAPAKTPAPVVDQLNAAIQAAVRTDEVKAGMAKLAVEPHAIAMDDFARLIASESDRWKAIVQTTGFDPTD